MDEPSKPVDPAAMWLLLQMHQLKRQALASWATCILNTLPLLSLLNTNPCTPETASKTSRVK